MKNILALLVTVATFCSFAAPDDTAVANRKWVRELLAKSGIVALNAKVVTNDNQTVTISSDYKSTSVTNAASISLTFSPVIAITNAAPVPAPLSLTRLLIPLAFADFPAEGADEPPQITLTLMSGEYLTTDIPPRRIEFALPKGAEFTLKTDSLDGLPDAAHVCAFAPNQCVCLNEGRTEAELLVEAEKQYPAISNKEFNEAFGDYSNWVDDSWEQKITIRGKTYYYLADVNDELHYLHDLDDTDAWKAAIQGALKIVNDWRQRQQIEFATSLKCDKTNPQHLWGDWEVVASSQASITYRRRCSRCGETESYTAKRESDPDTLPGHLTCSTYSHIAKPSGCGCLCGHYSAANPHAGTALHCWGENTCLCMCKHRHRAVESAKCPGICNYCARPAKDGVAGEIAAAPASWHTPCTIADGRCGCKCAHVTHVSDDPNFHIFRPGECRCLGDGNGGDWHLHMPKSGCPDVCAGNSSWGIDGEHCSARGHKVQSAPSPATPSHHVKVSGGVCGCNCGTYSQSNANTWGSKISTLHNSSSTLCGCFCGFATEGMIPDFHKFTSARNCRCQCLKKHQLVTGECSRVCFGANHGNEFFAGYYSYKDVAGKDLHKPLVDACGCACGEFEGRDYDTATHHHGSSYPECLCSCGLWHTPHKSPCEKICAKCKGWMRKGLAEDVMMSKPQSEDHTFPEDATYCGCACGGITTPHKCPEGDCYCYGHYASGSQYTHGNGTSLLVEHVDLVATGVVYTNVDECVTCGKSYHVFEREFQCANGHRELSEPWNDKTCAHTICQRGCDGSNCCSSGACTCPWCNMVVGAVDHCTCNGAGGNEDNAADHSILKFEIPDLTSDAVREYLASAFPESVTRIDGERYVQNILLRAFYGTVTNWPHLATVTFPSVTNIAAAAFEYAFKDCPALTRVEFPAVVKIGPEAFKEAFRGCSPQTPSFPCCVSVASEAFMAANIKYVYLPSCENFGSMVFSDSEAVEIDLPSLTTAGSSVFYGCAKLQRVSLPKCRILDGYAFTSCPSLRSVNLESMTKEEYTLVNDLDDLPSGCVVKFKDETYTAP